MNHIKYKFMFLKIVDKLSPYYYPIYYPKTSYILYKYIANNNSNKDIDDIIEEVERICLPFKNKNLLINTEQYHKIDNYIYKSLRMFIIKRNIYRCNKFIYGKVMKMQQ